LKKIFAKYVGENINLDISGGKVLQGILIDMGSDILVIYDGTNFLYIPVVHIHNISILDSCEIEITPPSETPNLDYNQEMSFRKILTSAKGIFTEIYVTSNQPLHGYIISVMNNYFVFYSPVYKTMLISMHHLKWLIPYSVNQRPYGLTNDDLPFKPAPFTIARTFEQQLEKHKGELVVFNIGDHPNVIGKLVDVQDNIIHLITAREMSIYLNLHHIKTLHFS
jgi:hypothetical protein